MTGKKPTNKDQTLPAKGEFLLYQTEDGQTRIEVRLQYETVWMTQAAIAELYQTTPQNITTHLKAQHRLAEEARQEILADDAELTRYLEKKK